MTLSDYVSSIKEKRIAVVGIGVSNEPLIRLLCFSGCDVTACDARSMEQMGMAALNLVAMGAKLRLGPDYLDRISDFDVIFRTPGLMPFEEHLAAAAANGSTLTSEMEVFFQVCPCKTIAVTGSDGKTTTSTMIAELLKASGFTVHLGGNIGHPLLCETPLMRKTDVAVLELSSFQLHSMSCRPDVAVITNISPNHLDKHGSFEDYVTAKKSIFLQQNSENTLILNRDDPLVSSFATETSAQVHWFSAAEPVDAGTYLKEGVLYRAPEEPLLRQEELTVPGIHNVKNFLAAAAATDGLVPAEVCGKVGRAFQGVEHRLETVRIYKGVTYINDSIATSPARTIAGLQSLRTKPVLILGGYDKGIRFESLAEEVCRSAKAVVLTGATAELIRTALLNAAESGRLPLPALYDEPQFDGAVQKAVEIAENGDTVLFSPACASFDSFKNFEERGQYFKQRIMEVE